MYYFDVQNDHFATALDMFASFFTCPLFTASASTREINAVDNENTKNLQSDMWREFQLLKSLADPSHPFSHFSTGNLQTLLDLPQSKQLDIRQMLLDFHAKYYSANIMKVVVYGNQSLDQLQQWAEEKFATIRNLSISPPVPSGLPYTAQQTGKYLTVIPVKEKKGLDIHFPFPATHKFYESKPASYLSHLIGHESEGSILAYLKELGYANGLSCGVSHSCSTFATFCIAIDLTSKGVDRAKDVISCVFQYIGLLKHGGVQQWIADEVKTTSDNHFRFIDKLPPDSYVVQLVDSMQWFPKEHIVSGQHLTFTPDTTHIPIFLNMLTPENAVIMLKHKQAETNLNEKWYGTEYAIRDISAEELKEWTRLVNEFDTHSPSKLALPKPNIFLPTEFDIKPLEGNTADAPKCIADVVIEESTAPICVPSTVEASTQADDEENCDESENASEEEEASATAATEDIPSVLPGRRLTTWALQDTKWRIPKLNVFIRLVLPTAYTCALNVSLCDLYSRMLKEVLSEFSYYADCAGLHFNIKYREYGLKLTFSGYHHKLPVLVEQTLSLMKSLTDESYLKSKSEMFDRLKEKQLRDYYNEKYSQPYYHCIYGTAACMQTPRYSSIEKYIALKPATLLHLVAFSTLLLQECYSEVFAHGNFTSSEAKELSESISLQLQANHLPYASEPIRRTVQLDGTAKEYIYLQHAANNNPREVNSAVENVYLVGSCISGEDLTVMPATDLTNPKSWGVIGEGAVLELVAHLLSEPAFNQLRTTEQLGYIVFTSRYLIGQQTGLRMIVQSNHKDAAYLDDRIEAFLEEYSSVLQTMSQDELQMNIDAVIENLLEKPKSLDEVISHFLCYSSEMIGICILL